MSKKSLWKKLKNPLSIFVGILIIVGIMSFPLLYFKSVDASRYNTEHFMKKITFALDTDAENVLMVKELHRILNSPYQDYEMNAQLIRDPSFLQEQVEFIAKEEANGVYIVDKITDEGAFFLYYDEATGKVIRVKHQEKKYHQKRYIKRLCTEVGDRQMQQDLNRFLRYLGLNIIEDWSYHGVLEFYDGYEEAKEGKADFVWYMRSKSAKLVLRAEPEKDGVKYYFQAIE